MRGLGRGGAGQAVVGAAARGGGRPQRAVLGRRGQHSVSGRCRCSRAHSVWTTRMHAVRAHVPTLHVCLCTHTQKHTHARTLTHAHTHSHTGDDRSDEDMFALIRDRQRFNENAPNCAVYACTGTVLFFHPSIHPFLHSFLPSFIHSFIHFFIFDGAVLFISLCARTIFLCMHARRQWGCVRRMRGTTSTKCRSCASCSRICKTSPSPPTGPRRVSRLRDRI